MTSLELEMSILILPLYTGPSASGAPCITPASINNLSAMPWLKNVKTLVCGFWGCEVRYELEQDIGPPISLLPQLERRIMVVGDGAEYTIPQSGLKWSNRPQRELEFINPDDAWTKITEECFDGWYNEVAKARRPKLTVKKAFRGGIVPKVVRGYTNGNILKAEDETEEKYQA
jgi:hypothetical protein